MVSTRIITTGRALTSSTSAPRFPRVPCSHAPPNQLRKVASTAAARPRNPVARVAYTPLSFTHRNTDFDESLCLPAEQLGIELPAPLDIRCPQVNPAGSPERGGMSVRHRCSLNRSSSLLHRPESPQDLIALSRPAAEADRPRVATRREERRCRTSTRRLSRRWRSAGSSSILRRGSDRKVVGCLDSARTCTKPSFRPASLTPPYHSPAAQMRSSRCCASVARIVVRSVAR